MLVPKARMLARQQAVILIIISVRAFNDCIRSVSGRVQHLCGHLFLL